MARRLYRRRWSRADHAAGRPGMLDEYVRMCDTVFAGVGVEFSAEELAHLRAALEGQLADAYAASPRSSIVITYDSPVGTVLNYPINSEWQTIESAYEGGSAPGAAAIRHRTRRASVGAGRRSSRSREPSGARHRRRNRAQRPGPGPAGPPGGRGRDDRAVRRHHPCGGRTGITGHPRHPARRVRDDG